MSGLKPFDFVNFALGAVSINLRRVIAIATGMVMLAGVLFSSTVRAVPSVDGFLSTGEYSNSFEAGWYNGHNTAGSQYPNGGQTATVFYENVQVGGVDDGFYLYLAAPIEAKNMIWGTGFTDAEALSYYQHWCSPSSGAAAADGSNCNHHDKGFATFKDDKTNYGGMTGSEKVEIGGFKADLTGAAGANLNGFSVLEYKDSVDYVIASLSCDTTNCDANDTPMAFEFRFGALTDAERDGLIGYIQSNKLAFHLSPERGAAPIPEPETYAMLLAGLGLLGWHARRRKQKENVAA
jgi:hypothetical protein